MLRKIGAVLDQSTMSHRRTIGKFNHSIDPEGVVPRVQFLSDCDIKVQLLINL